MKRRVNLSEITAKEPLKVRTEIRPSVMNLPEEEISGASPFKIEVEIAKKPTGYQLKGRVSGEVELTCSRCAKKFKHRVEQEFNYRLLPTSEIKGGEVRSSDLDIKFSDETLLDLAEVTQEQILLNLPVKPVCSEECEEVHYREWEDRSDNRWEKLKSLQNKLKKE